MDPVTQGVVGAAAGQSVGRRHSLGVASVLGALGGMAPDLDILIRSSTDPFVALEYHRQFTHSLLFIPLGGLLVALLSFFLFARSRLDFKQTYLFCTAGYATHALLDACTTYGTLLLWPFSDMRVAWNVVSVIDPLFTVPTLVLLLLVYWLRDRRFLVIALAWMSIYLVVGVIQSQRAATVALELADSRGHRPGGLGMKPSFANIIVWKSVYEHEGRYYVDAIRVGATTSVIPGTSTPKLDLSRDFPWLNPASQQAKDVERFRWFSNRHLGLDPDNPARIIDVRYSLLPNEVSGMWGIELSPTAPHDAHADYTVNRAKGGAARQKVQQLWSMILGD